MYSRNIKSPPNSSFFLFGPRGTGKSFWIRHKFNNAIYIDLLEADTFTRLMAAPGRIDNLISDNFTNWVVIDEIQKVPKLLDEVHRLIEQKNLKFILTGSSPRKLRRESSNLLAGRALNYKFFPLSALELKKDFDLEKALKFGLLPTIYDNEKNIDPQKYLESYVQAYLREEIQQEGLTRNLGAFARFLETASFSQASVLNISEISRDCGINRKVAESYFNILEDLMIGIRLPVFSKKAKRRIIKHSKFYFFDTGVYRTIRPKGILDTPEHIDGSAIETLVFQELQALTSNLDLKLDLYYWRTSNNDEVDFILYGEDGFFAIEVKRSKNIKPKDLKGLKTFLNDYPMAKPFIFYGGEKNMYFDKIKAIPLENGLKKLNTVLFD